MMTRTAHPRRHGALAMTWLLTASLSPAAMAFAQTAQPPAPNSAAPVSAAAAQVAPQAPAPAAQAAAPASQPRGLFPAQPPPAGQPGFIYEFGRWWDSTHVSANGAAEATQDALKHAAEATKEAATALIRIPAGRFIEVHQRCALAPNGAARLPLGGGECLPHQGLSGRQPCQRAIITKSARPRSGCPAANPRRANVRRKPSS